MEASEQIRELERRLWRVVQELTVLRMQADAKAQYVEQLKREITELERDRAASR